MALDNIRLDQGRPDGTWKCGSLCLLQEDSGWGTSEEFSG